jgi:hypothetical protein
MLGFRRFVIWVAPCARPTGAWIKRALYTSGVGAVTEALISSAKLSGPRPGQASGAPPGGARPLASRRGRTRVPLRAPKQRSEQRQQLPRDGARGDEERDGEVVGEREEDANHYDPERM